MLHARASRYTAPAAPAAKASRLTGGRAADNSRVKKLLKDTEVPKDLLVKLREAGSESGCFDGAADRSRRHVVCESDHGTPSSGLQLTCARAQGARSVGGERIRTSSQHAGAAITMPAGRCGGIEHGMEWSRRQKYLCAACHSAEGMESGCMLDELGWAPADFACSSSSRGVNTHWPSLKAKRDDFL